MKWFSNLKIGAKLALLTLVLVSSTVAVGFLGLTAFNEFNRSLAASMETAKLSNQALNTARNSQVRFKVQVQEWKNILLRGNDSESFEKYNSNFAKEEEEVQKNLADLKKLMKMLNMNTDKIDEAHKFHQELGVKYREALVSYDKNNPGSYKVVDNIVKGIDRAPTEAIDNIVNQIEEESNRIMAEAQKKSDSQLSKARTYFVVFILLSVLLAIILAILISRQIVRPVKLLNEELTALAERGGDLTREIRISSGDEIGDLALSVNRFLSNIRSIMIEVNKSATDVSETARQLTCSAQQTSAGATETASTMGEVSVTVEQLNSNVQEITAVSETAAEKASEGNEGIARFSQQMKVISGSTREVSGAIEGLNQKSQEINQIVDLITSIADQTNLLALNAAIEAARAGEQGRGFAVVAEEVRSLAEQSGSAAKEIYSLINSIQTESQRAVETMSIGGKEVESGMMVVQEVGETFKIIIGSVQDLTSQIQEVAVATGQMSSGVQNVAASTEEQTAAMEEVSASAEALSQLAEYLTNLIGKFKV